MNSKPFRLILQFVFYFFVLFIFVSRSLTVGFSHDENQFIAAGQLLAYHGLLPYINYPYTHMPYGAFFYALTAWISNYDFLAGRLLNAVAFLICSLGVVKAFRLISGARTSLSLLLWEFVVVYIFLSHRIMGYVIGAALNHALPALFSLIALILFIASTQGKISSRRLALFSGVCLSIAALIRFNYAGLILVGLFLWTLLQLFSRPRPLVSVIKPFIAGLFLAALPALILFALAPTNFYYGNIVYIRLNTLYYQELLYKFNMSLGSKIMSFLTDILRNPLDLILYILLLYTGLASLIRYRNDRSAANLNRFAVAAFAFSLFLSAFAPTPTLQHYFFDALPFLILILALSAYDFFDRIRGGYLLAASASILLLYFSGTLANPAKNIARLSNPSQWTPMQVHNFGLELKTLVPGGRVLTLLPMIPLEAGYDVYPFTATGPFSWRTSTLLTAQRRLQYGVTSPAELNSLLEKSPPAAILTGFESSNAGFSFVPNESGGLEGPFIAYAQANGYEPYNLEAQFLRRTVTLWVKPP